VQYRKKRLQVPLMLGSKKGFYKFFKHGYNVAIFSREFKAGALYFKKQKQAALLRIDLFNNPVGC
jgi:hypothetical protein